MKRPSCDNCLIRNIVLSDLYKNGVVSQRAFRDNDPDGLSLTETRNEIRGLEDLEDYITVASGGLSVRIGVAVMDARDCRSVGLNWRPDPHTDHRFGHLHVLGPVKDELTTDLRNECARLANLTEWSKGPGTKPA
jgi:hypothetical protein